MPLSILIFRDHLLILLNVHPSILWLITEDCIHFSFWGRGHLLIFDYRSWLLYADFSQHTLSECYKPFQEIGNQYPKWWIFLNFVYSTCRKHSVCQLVRLYSFKCHESIATRYYNHKRFRFFWDIYSISNSNCNMVLCISASHLVWQYSGYSGQVCLCPELVSVLNVWIRSFCACERFPWWRGWCMWWRLESLLLSSRPHQAMWVFAWFLSSRSTDWFLVPSSILSLQFEDCAPPDVLCNISSAALGELR